MMKVNYQNALLRKLINKDKNSSVTFIRRKTVIKSLNISCHTLIGIGKGCIRHAGAGVIYFGLLAYLIRLDKVFIISF